MRALLLIAHGSRLQASNQEVQELCWKLAHKLDAEFDQVKAAFLELCSPSISQAIDELAASQFTEIIVLPYFLNQGRHVSQDVPAELEAKIAQYPRLSIKSLPYFGRSEMIAEFLTDIIRRQL